MTQAAFLLYSVQNQGLMHEQAQGKENVRRDPTPMIRATIFTLEKLLGQFKDYSTSSSFHYLLLLYYYCCCCRSCCRLEVSDLFLDDDYSGVLALSLLLLD